MMLIAVKASRTRNMLQAETRIEEGNQEKKRVDQRDAERLQVREGEGSGRKTNCHACSSSTLEILKEKANQLKKNQTCLFWV